MPLEFKPTNRGFLRAEFTDRYGINCSIQESSLATEETIWLGCNDVSFDEQGQQCGARMHLTREMAAELLAPLARFVATGRLHE